MSLFTHYGLPYKANECSPVWSICEKNISITGFTSLCVWFREREDKWSEWMVAGFIQSLESLEKVYVFKVMLELEKIILRRCLIFNIMWCFTHMNKKHLFLSPRINMSKLRLHRTKHTVNVNMNGWWLSSKCSWNVLLKSCANAVREDVCLEVTEGRIVWLDRSLYLYKVFSCTRNICPGSS